MIPDEWNTSERAIPNAPVESLGVSPCCATVTQIGHGNAKRLLLTKPSSAHSSEHIRAVEEAFADFSPDTPAYPRI
jgi:hypothetical protein